CHEWGHDDVRGGTRPAPGRRRPHHPAEGGDALMAIYDSWIADVRTQLGSVIDAFWGEVKENGLLPLLEPVAPFNRPQFLSPAVAIGGLLGIVLLSGLAVTAFGSLLLTLLALYIILVEVFGFTVEVQPFGAS